MTQKKFQPLDAADSRLLAALQTNANLSTEQLAERCGLSPSTVQRRLRTLREADVLECSVAVLNPRALGPLTTVLAMVETDRERPQDRDGLRRWCEAQDAVQQAYYVTGTADLMMVVITPSIEAFDALMQTFQEAHPIVRRITTNVVIQTFKRGLALPLEY
ncbi:Lrp/AsnC family transcriptional regulator [Kiloniella sp. EL199]|uniref:Lrp/AsnC family transcriptional regulator n=1 Tax=Kiloniella sp. EL199 TaxID=2107581 RepID=UPI000EA2C6D2|nr:Lrp/AsnC family transcriptional regulator [Kiloniella sp. EL199]